VDVLFFSRILGVPPTSLTSIYRLSNSTLVKYLPRHKHPHKGGLSVHGLARLRAALPQHWYDISLAYITFLLDELNTEPTPLLRRVQAHFGFNPAPPHLLHHQFDDLMRLLNSLVTDDTAYLDTYCSDREHYFEVNKTEIPVRCLHPLWLDHLVSLWSTHVNPTTRFAEFSLPYNLYLDLALASPLSAFHMRLSASLSPSCVDAPANFQALSVLTRIADALGLTVAPLLARAQTEAQTDYQPLVSPDPSTLLADENR
jgi:hypothetical protein